MKLKQIYILTFFLFWLLFFPTQIVIDNPTYDGWVKNVFILYMLFTFRNKIPKMIKGEFRWFNISIVSFCLIMIFSIILNEDTINFYETSRFKNGEEREFTGVISPKQTVYYSLSLISVTLFIEELVRKGQVKLFIDTLFKYSIMLFVWSNIDAFSHTVVDDSIGGYILGTKFQVCYYNLFVCTIYGLKNPNMTRKDRMLFLFFIAITFASAIHTQCSTMVVGTLVYLAALFLLPQKIQNKMSSGAFLVALILIADLGFFFFTTWLLQFTIVQDFIVDVLHEDLTLTGRLTIFGNIMEALNNNIWFGYGYGNSSIISVYYMCGENPQNGIIEMFLNVGIIGCMAFLMIIYNACRLFNTKRTYNNPTIAYIFTMIVISTIEVPFEKTFIFVTSLLILSNYRTSIIRK